MIVIPAIVAAVKNGTTPRKPMNNGNVSHLSVPVTDAPEHTRRFIMWSKQQDHGNVFLLVGYCPQTLPYYMGLTQDLLKAFPDADLTKVGFHQVTASRWCKGFTLLTAEVNGPEREIPGYEVWESIDFNY